MLTIVKSILFILFTIYLVYGFLLYFGQKKIIFYPVQKNEFEIQTIQKKYKEFLYKNVKLKNYYITFWETKNSSDTIILYFGGNAENTNYTLLSLIEFPYLLKYKWFFFNYPGYNGSNQQPSEKSFYESSIEFFDWVKSYSKSENKKIIIMGRSLGSAVAIYLASQREISGLILITPFDSLITLAKKYYPFYPVNLLLKHKFNSKPYIKFIKSPILILVARKDEIIPSSSTEELIKSIPPEIKKTVHFVEFADHNSISSYPEYYLLIQKFIDE